ncbi:hypothetical protein [Streptomyces hirsutus]|uniref:hypothetical protein n=1 Tax=Streptomyces hirsutus TaxID=35620 RepID=UPI001F0AA488|nr:hypothetical protein [Streptomyces hirsutus]
MLLGMICALASAICYGTASVLQAVAARAAEPGTGSGLDPALLSRVLRQWRCLAGLALDGIGFLFPIVVLRSIPLYAVGSALAAGLAVTAVAAVRLLGIRLSRTRWGAVAAVCAGLTMIGLASGPEGNRAAPAALGRSLPATVVVVLLSGALLGRLPAGPRALPLGLGAGLGFGTVQVAVRLIDSLAVPGILLDPAPYALLVGGATGFLFLTSAFQRGSVTVATAGMVLGETIGPALVGVAWLGGRPREGLQGLAFAGCAVTAAGSLTLARFGEPSSEGAGERSPG